jgi:hypothetical protein
MNGAFGATSGVELSRPRRAGGSLTACRCERLHGVLGAESGTRLDMPGVAEHVCQSCGKVTWSDVPKRTDTMPACPCGGRRQIVRIRHTAAEHVEGSGLSSAERSLD